MRNAGWRQVAGITIVSGSLGLDSLLCQKYEEGPKVCFGSVGG